MREIDEPQHAVNHRVPQRDQSIDRPEREAVEQLLEEFGQVELRAKSLELRADQIRESRGPLSMRLISSAARKISV